MDTNKDRPISLVSDQRDIFDMQTFTINEFKRRKDEIVPIIAEPRNIQRASFFGALPLSLIGRTNSYIKKARSPELTSSQSEYLALSGLAACIGIETNVFFPEQGESDITAKTICNSCPIKKPCLENALDSQEHHGIWGGMNISDRKTELKRRKLAEE